MPAFKAWQERLIALGPKGRPAAYYVSYILELCVLDRLGHRPSESELQQLTAEQDPSFSKIIGGSLARSQRLELLEGTFRRMFEYSFPDSVGGVVWLVYMAAATGGFLVAPEKQLAKLRPRLSRYITEYLPEVASNK